MTDTANAPERYGATRVTKIRAAYNDLRQAIASGDLDAAQVAFDRYEAWSDYVLDARHATHCDELVAAAYVAASEKAWAIAVEMELHAAIGSTTKAKAEAIEGAILSGTPDNARAALTSYGERMRAEGAREAQAKIARLAEALNRSTGRPSTW